jgi:hypothetical protein
LRQKYGPEKSEQDALSAVIGLFATVLLWAVIVAGFYGFTKLMMWVTSRIFRLKGRGE